MYQRHETRKSIAATLHRLSGSLTRTAQALKATDVLARHMDVASTADLEAGIMRDTKDIGEWLKWAHNYLVWMKSEGRWTEEVPAPKRPERSWHMLP